MLQLEGFGPLLLQGTWVTVQQGILSLIVSFVIGLVAAAAKLSRNRLASGCATLYTTIIRGIPDLVLMLFAIGALQGRWQSGADGLLIRRAPVRYPTAPLDPTCRPLPTSA